jgi:cytochrome c peroxidase
VLSLLLLFACETEKPAPKPVEAPKPVAAPAVTVAKEKLAIFGALPAEMKAEKYSTSPELVALGRALYYENRLSKNQDISCNTCHQLDAYGVDGKPTSPGHKGQLGNRNSPTSYNAAGHFVQFWDGRAADVEAQAKGPVLNPVEMAMPGEKQVVAILKSIPGYEAMFKAAFPNDKDPITYDNVALAIGAFERGLVTPAPWDRYLAGNESALTEAQKKGFNTYMDVGCATCHSGTYVGGSMYQKAGLVVPWPNSSDKGRGALTNNEAENFMFKVPSLRNIEKTGPYFHDGSVADLDEAIRMMGKHQLGKELTPEQVADIRAYLGALTGEIPSSYVAKPALPESGPTTPKPDPS